MTDYNIQHIIDKFGGNFTPKEFLDNRNSLQSPVIEEIVKFRNWGAHDWKLQITSAWRETGSHKFGLSIDFLLWKIWKQEQPDIMQMWNGVTAWPWHGIGVYFDWQDGVGFHVDLLQPPTRQRPLRWLRKEGKYYYQDIRSGIFLHRDSGQLIDTTTLANEITQYSD